jgi:hypothetical protein
MDVDQQFAPQAGDPDRGRQMIDGRGGEDGEPYRLEAGRYLDLEARQGAVELDSLQEGEPMGGDRCQRFETVRRLDPSQRRAQVLAEVASNRQPVHHRRTRAVVCTGTTSRSARWIRGNRPGGQRLLFLRDTIESSVPLLEKRHGTTAPRSPFPCASHQT